jgi:hypothetical protein
MAEVEVDASTAKPGNIPSLLPGPFTFSPCTPSPSSQAKNPVPSQLNA